MKAILAYLLIATIAIAASFKVSNWDELKTAWNAQTLEDTTILIDGVVVAPSSLDWLKPTAHHGNELVFRFGPDGGIDWNASYSGSARTAMNGMQFRGRSLLIVGGTMSNYNVSGSAVRADVPCERVRLVNVWFRNVGQTSYAPLRSPVKTAHDAIVTNCVGVFHAGCTVEVFGGGAEDCGRASHTWNHVYYLVVDAVRIVGVTIRRCGSPFAVLSRLEPCMIVGNDVDEWQLCMHPESREPHRASYVFALYDDAAKQELWAIGNRFAGSPSSYVIIGGTLDQARVIMRNDVSGLTPTKWATVKNEQGQWLPVMDLAAWQALGNDVPKAVATQPRE